MANVTPEEWPELKVTGKVCASGQQYPVTVRLRMDDRLADLFAEYRLQQAKGLSEPVAIGHLLQIEAAVPWIDEWDCKLVMFKTGNTPCLQVGFRNALTGVSGNVDWDLTGTSVYSISLIGLALECQLPAFRRLIVMQRPSDDYAAVTIATLARAMAARQWMADFVHAMADEGIEFYSLEASADLIQRLDATTHAWLHGIYRERELSLSGAHRSTTSRQRL